jgi:hypothetical protein
MSDDDDDMDPEVADLEEKLENMSDEEMAAFDVTQARLRADLEAQLEELEQEGKLSGLEPLLATIHEVQAMADKLLALAKAKKRPN